MSRFYLYLFLVLVACSGGGAGSVQVNWSGTQSGTLAVAGRASLCTESRIVELVALRADSGVAVVLYPEGDLVAGGYPIFDPESSVETRPGAGVAFRWFDLVQIKGFEAVDGEVRVDGADPASGLSGSLDVRLRTVDATSDTLILRGDFRVPLDTAPAGCGAVTRRRPA